MAVRIRLRRIGKKKMPMYHIVAADSRAARNGKFLEVIGRYEPLQNPMVVSTTEDRVFYWLRNGALPTDTVRSLFQRSGLWMKWTMTKKGWTTRQLPQKWRSGRWRRRKNADTTRPARRAAEKHGAGRRRAEKPNPLPLLLRKRQPLHRIHRLVFFHIEREAEG